MAAAPITIPQRPAGHHRPSERAFVSIIIPTLNEVHNVGRHVASLSRLPQAEIIFADGGSSDGTVDEIKSCTREAGNVHLVQAAQCRARQMNAGARRATGEWLIFLHADTELPHASFVEFLETVKKNPRLNAGAFSFKISHPRWVYRYLEFYVGLRCRVMGLPYGDQAIFVRRSYFEAIGGYRDDFPLMEDMEFVERCNRNAGFSILRQPVYTSARRFEAEGYLRRTCSNLYLQILYKFGVHPRELAKRYWK